MKSVCVYCGSNSGRRQAYANAARDLAAALVERDLKLVYGGASVGIMGVLADAVLEYGGEVAGVIPHALVEKEVAHGALTELHVTQSMHQRKTLMADLSDAFITLPGGLGTLEETFEILTWAQLGFHRKPCGLLNIGGYFEHLAAFLNYAVAEQFIKKQHRSMLMIENNAKNLLDRILGECQF